MRHDLRQHSIAAIILRAWTFSKTQGRLLTGQILWLPFLWEAIDPHKDVVQAAAGTSEAPCLRGDQRSDRIAAWGTATPRL